MKNQHNPLNSLETRRPSAADAIPILITRVVILALVTAISLLFCPLYYAGRRRWGRPANVVRFDQVVRYLRLTWTVRPPAPGLTPLVRLALTLSILQKALLTPVLGVAWLLDELLYGRALDATDVEAPLFVVSAARSGSTQITRYLEDDPALVAPSLLQCMFPYLWLWRLVPRTIGRFVTPEAVRDRIAKLMPPEGLERHELDPFKADTFDGAFYSIHLNALAFSLGPEAIATEFNLGKAAPHNRRLWNDDFVGLVDRLARKTLRHAGPGPDGASRRFLLKGHFLAGAEALAQRYPDARFLTVVRDPVARLQSGINYMRVNPVDPALGPVPWEWLVAGLTRTETDYCLEEQAWFSESGPGRRCVIRFSDFVRNLEAAMRDVYQCCLDMDELPPHVPTTHPPRDRKNYTVNRSLAELGVDEVALRARLAEYIA